jgi:hypothetical protein
MSDGRKPEFMKNPDTCPGLKDLIRPTMSYVKCHVCSADIEIWSDEDKATCDSCGAEWRKPDENASCLSYCEFADKCRAILAARKQ